jgi:hypothetical protein
MFFTLVTESLAEARQDEKASNPYQMEEFVYKKIVSAFGYFKNRLIKSKEQRETNEGEHATK